MTEQLTLFNLAPAQVIKTVSDPYWDEITAPQHSDDDRECELLVGAQVKPDTKKSAPQHDTQWVEKYWVERSGNKYWYYRYCWMTGRKKNRRYLGSVDNPKARLRKQEVEIAIADGLSPLEIENLIRSLREMGRQGTGGKIPNTSCPMTND